MDSCSTLVLMHHVNEHWLCPNQNVKKNRKIGYLFSRLQIYKKY